MAAQGENPGWAGLAAPEDGWALLVPLTAAALRAGVPLAERARERALERYGDSAVAEDILGGNALLALESGTTDARGAAAACLGAIAALTQSPCFVVAAVRRGDVIDCRLEHLDRGGEAKDYRAAAARRIAKLLNIPLHRVVPGAVVERSPPEA